MLRIKYSILRDILEAMGQESGPQPLDINTVMREIQGLWGEVNQLGRNDVEGPKIAQIVRDLEMGKVTPEQALKEARMLKEGKHEPGEKASN